MKTYKRKRPDDIEIPKVLDLCRLCLAKPEDAVPLFADSESQCSALALRIMACVGFEISKENMLPNQICMKCHEELERSYAFKKKCEISNQKLKSHVQAVKVREANEKREKETEAIKIKVAEILKQKSECSSGDKNNDSSETPSIAFMVNLNGSIQLCEKVSSVYNPKPKNSLLKSNNLQTETPQRTIFIKEMLPNQEILQSVVCSVPAPHNTMSIENNKQQVSSVKDLLHYIEQSANITVTSQSVIETDAKEANTNALVFSTEDFTNVLSRILLGLGVITEDVNNLILSDEPKTVEFEMGDESRVTFEFVEEDDNGEMMETASEIPSTNTMHKPEELPRNTLKCNSQNTKENLSIRGHVVCSLCRKAFRSRSVLTRHVRNVHKGERPHVCDTCGKRFAQKSVLHRHMLVHAEKRPYPCTECSKSFTQRKSLESHARHHAPPSAPHLHIYKCPKCPKVFMYSSGVSRHMVVHTSKTFDCGTCGRPFKDRGSLLRHMRVRKHQDQPSISTNSILK